MHVIKNKSKESDHGRNYNASNNSEENTKKHSQEGNNSSDFTCFSCSSQLHK